MGISRIFLFPITLTILCFLSFDASAQRVPLDKNEILPGDDILFLSGLETQNRSVTDTTAKDIFYQYLDKSGEVRDSSIARHLVVKAYKNVEGRRRIQIFQKGTKVRWKQRGQSKEGFVELYSAAKENIDVMRYTDELIEKVEIPAQYLSPYYGEPSRSDTIKLLSQIWEAEESLLMFPIQDSIEECFPLLEKIVLTPSYKEKKVQYIFKELQFAMLMKDDLETGVVGSWKLKGNQIHITTAVAALPEDEAGKKEQLRCTGTYIYKFKIDDEGNRLTFDHVGPLPYIPEPEPDPEPVTIPDINTPPTTTSVKFNGTLHPFWRDKY